MAKSPKRSQIFLPLAMIGLVSFLVAGTVMAAAANMGFGASVLTPVPGDHGYSVSLFRTHQCGNGKVEYREQCDDGNRRSGDGCSRSCRLESSICGSHQIGERFPASDDCNFCVCTANGVTCTMRACLPTSSSASSSSGMTKCLSSEQCPAKQYCTTENGDCRPACSPGAMCIQVCAGICRSNVCKPYACPDGARIPSCTEDGHVINYFADPCLTHRASSSTAARCGNGICEDKEADWCPACTSWDPPCMAPCSAGTCPEDCVSKSSTVY